MPATISVTDHAVCRYLERVLGYPVAALRERLGTESDTELVRYVRLVRGLDVEGIRQRLRGIAETCGDPRREVSLPVNRRYRIILKDRAIVTVKHYCPNDPKSLFRCCPRLRSDR